MGEPPGPGGVALGEEGEHPQHGALQKNTALFHTRRYLSQDSSFVLLPDKAQNRMILHGNIITVWVEMINGAVR